jgi:hypothetical protein
VRRWPGAQSARQWPASRSLGSVDLDLDIVRQVLQPRQFAASLRVGSVKQNIDELVTSTP